MDEIDPQDGVGGPAAMNSTLPSDPGKCARILENYRPADTAEGLKTLDLA